VEPPKADAARNLALRLIAARLGADESGHEFESLPNSVTAETVADLLYVIEALVEIAASLAAVATDEEMRELVGRVADDDPQQLLFVIDKVVELRARKDSS
jgi:hypothetical protein